MSLSANSFFMRLVVAMRGLRTTTRARLLLTAFICELTNGKKGPHVVTISVGTLATNLQMSRSAIQRATRELVTLGLLVVERNPQRYVVQVEPLLKRYAEALPRIRAESRYLNALFEQNERNEVTQCP
jgi:DNA-binding IclR family transcriptional regulator